MPLSGSPTELTTAATDAAMACVCFVALVQLVRFRVTATWKQTLWGWVLALFGTKGFGGFWNPSRVQLLPGVPSTDNKFPLYAESAVIQEEVELRGVGHAGSANLRPDLHLTSSPIDGNQCGPNAH